MPPIAVWGPPVWNLFHTLAEKIKDEKYAEIGPQLIKHIKNICSHLPCPSCSQHATQFFAKAPPHGFATKERLKEGLFFFHNIVNRRTNKPIRPITMLNEYKTHNVARAYNSFIRVYNTRGNMKLLTDTFQRQIIIRDFKKWLIANIDAFNA